MPSVSGLSASPAAVVAGFFLRLRPPREPRRVFFFTGAASAPSSIASACLLLGLIVGLVLELDLAGLRLVDLAPRPRRLSSLSTSSASASTAFLARLGARVGFSASLSKVIGSDVGRGSREQARVGDAVEHAADANLRLLADELRSAADDDVDAVELADCGAGVVLVELDQFQVDLATLCDRRLGLRGRRACPRQARPQ